MLKSKLIQMIHIAKGQLELDDDTYRSLLNGETGKTSCSKMSKTELEAVYSRMKHNGFKPFKQPNKQGLNKRLSPKTDKSNNDERSVIRSIWATMAKQGFVADGSETALDAYVNRMLNPRTVEDKHQGENVSFHVQFIYGKQAFKVLESLKNWHKRAMIKFLSDNEIKALKAVLNPQTQEVSLRPINLAGLKTTGYQQVCQVFGDSVNEALSLSNLSQSNQS